MDASFSKTQIDRLGERLKTEAWSTDDLQLLDAYRRSFGPAARVEKLRRKLSTLDDRSSDEAKSIQSLLSELARVEREAQHQLEKIIRSISEQAAESR